MLQASRREAATEDLRPSDVAELMGASQDHPFEVGITLPPVPRGLNEVEEADERLRQHVED
jgi:hypothetical protein